MVIKSLEGSPSPVPGGRLMFARLSGKRKRVGSKRKDGRRQYPRTEGWPLLVQGGRTAARGGERSNLGHVSLLYRGERILPGSSEKNKDQGCMRKRKRSLSMRV